MKLLFEQGPMAILESLSFTKTLYAFDFDGTLAPIVKDPDEARMSSATERLLFRFADHVPTAIISGRTLQDLRRRVSGPVRYLIANHGLEGLPGATPLDELRKLCCSWKASIESRLSRLTSDPGIIVEDKEFSISIHYRHSRQKKTARLAILESLEGLSSAARIVPGKLVFSVVHEGGPHKGIALTRLMSHSGLGFAFYIGDDHTDEDVFSMKEPSVFSVRVGRSQRSSARYFVRRQTDINRLLRGLLTHHRIGF